MVSILVAQLFETFPRLAIGSRKSKITRRPRTDVADSTDRLPDRLDNRRVGTGGRRRKPAACRSGDPHPGRARHAQSMTSRRAVHHGSNAEPSAATGAGATRFEWPPYGGNSRGKGRPVTPCYSIGADSSLNSGNQTRIIASRRPPESFR